MYSANLGRNLTPEEEANVNAMVDDWLQQNVETKKGDDGETLFRLKPKQP